MKRIRIYLCAVIYIGLTCAKLVLPASAADLRSTVREQVGRNDIARIRPEDLYDLVKTPSVDAAGGTYTVVPPLEKMESERAGHAHAYFSGLPAGLLHTEPGEAVQQELAHAVALDAAYAARETFLAEQEPFADRTLPANVSYEIPELPFSTAVPVAGACSSGFGYRIHPIRQVVRFHYGTDFAANTGTDICAFASGTVIAAGKDAGYGNYLKLDHGSGYVTLYGHCSELLVSEGDPVQAGQVIARVGATGQATGPHLHFELMHDGVYLNPEFYLAA